MNKSQKSIEDEDLDAEIESIANKERARQKSIEDETLDAKIEYIANKERNRQPEKSGRESFVRGAAQGLSFGFADEITGGVNAFKEALMDGKNLKDSYIKHRDESRLRYKEAQEANPSAFLAGDVVGSIASGVLTRGRSAPLSITRLALQGATRAAGSSDEESISEIAKDAAQGAVTGVALKGVGKVGALVNKRAGNIAKSLHQSGNGIAPQVKKTTEEWVAKKVDKAADWIIKSAGTGIGAGSGLGGVEGYILSSLVKEPIKKFVLTPVAKKSIMAYLTPDRVAKIAESGKFVDFGKYAGVLQEAAKGGASVLTQQFADLLADKKSATEVGGALIKQFKSEQKATDQIVKKLMIEDTEHQARLLNEDDFENPAVVGEALYAQSFNNTPSKNFNGLVESLNATQSIDKALENVDFTQQSKSNTVPFDALSKFLNLPAASNKQEKVDNLLKFNDLLASLLTNPDLQGEYAQQIIEAFAKTGAPKIGEALAFRNIEALRYLDSQAPKPPQFFDPFNNKRWEPSDAELNSFNKKVAAVVDPMSVVSKITAGTVTKDELDAFETVYPGLYEHVRNTLYDQITSKPNSLSYGQRLKYAMILGTSVPGVESGRNAAMLQASFGEQNQQVSEPGGNVKSLKAQAPTDAQRLEAK